MRVAFKPLPSIIGPPIYYPLLRVSLSKRHGPKSRPFEAMVDSGSADCIFHSSVASAIGIKLESGRKEIRTGIGGPQDVWIHPIQLWFSANMLSIEGAFTKELPFAGLLGRSGFFEHYRITFDPSAVPSEMELERIHRA